MTLALCKCPERKCTGSHTSRQQGSGRSRTKAQAFFGPASAFSTWTHFPRGGLVSPDARAFLLSGLLALWGCGSSTHNLEGLSSHWQSTAEYEGILNKTLALVQNLKKAGNPHLEVEKAKGSGSALKVTGGHL